MRHALEEAFHPYLAPPLKAVTPVRGPRCPCMETLHAQRRESPQDTWTPTRTESMRGRTPTPIYNALVREWDAAGRTVPARPTTTGSGIRFPTTR